MESNYSHLMQIIVEGLQKYRGRTGAFIDYPTYKNVGDMFIWLGTETYFNHQSIKIKSRLNAHNLNIEILKNFIKPEDVLFLHGGGNFNDLYNLHNKCRISVIRAFPDNDIVVLPQTIFFKEENKLKEIADVFNQHDKLLLCPREEKSYELAAKYFKCELKMLPDMAFCLDLKKTRKPTQKILYFKRTDVESNDRSWSLNKNISSMDWKDIQVRKSLAYKAKNHLGFRMQRILKQIGNNNFYMKGCEIEYNNYLKQAELYTWHAIDLFSDFSEVFTDRLHGHIISTMLGIKNNFMPNSYYKNETFFSTWTSGLGYASMQ